MRTHLLSRFGRGLVLGSVALGCSSNPSDDDPGTTGGTPGAGGSTTGGKPATGGSPAIGGTPAIGGKPASAGSFGFGGSPQTGGTVGTAGSGKGGSAAGGAGATAGSSTGGRANGGSGGGGNQGGSGGKAAGGAGGSMSGGAAGAGGSAGMGGASTGGTGGGTKSKGCGAATWPKSATSTISVSGASRTYILRIPDNYDTNKPYRLIFSFHWLNGTAQNVAMGGGTTKSAFYGLWDLSAGSTIFVAPQGINNGWSDAGRSTSKGGDDINFTRTLLTQLEDTLCIDTTRIFAEGFSMGGSMSYAVACALGDLFRGIAVHSGGPMSGCVTPHNKPVAYFMTHGTTDSVCTYPGYGVPQVNDFAKVNGCMARSMPTPSGSTQSCVDFEGCMPGYPTRACIFVGDHTPSPPNASNTWVPAETWKFISQF
jgi:polyhydroxybutyrate depolymerase